jgi:glycosyltransferase involved in cell wall biosynthesis
VTPKYSFIIPAYNEEALLARTLQTLRQSAAALQGTFEIIVANDASTDRTPEIARQNGARVVDVKKRQIAGTRNAGAAVATGEIFIFVDADTLVPPATLLSLERLMADPRVVAGGARMVFDRPPPFFGRVFAAIFLRVYFAVGLAAGGFIFARADAFRKAGCFDERYFASEEVHLSRALKRLGKLKIIREPVITSARKFRMKTAREHFALFRNMARKGKKGWEQRDGLDLWYDGSREKEQPPGKGTIEH